MKSCLLVVSLIMLFLNNLSGAIRNGYEKSIPGLMLSLQGLQNILYCDSTLTRAERRAIRKKLKLVISNIAYYRITDRLLNQFRTIAPDLYREIETLKDAAGNAVDVYVKYIPGTNVGFRAGGMSSLTQARNNPHSCNSEYGPGTVSVLISTVNKTLRVLAHEFGHLVYVVPNMESYTAFFRKRYKGKDLDIPYGHDLRDQSGKNAMLFEKRFCLTHKRYLRQESIDRKTFVVGVGAVRKDLLTALAFQ